MVNKVSGKILKIVSSRGFFWFVIGFFIFEAAWIALTAAYPQAFDEQFHFGLIKNIFLPFISFLRQATSWW